MEDIVKSLKAYLYERTASPLIGAFTVSWLIINYRASIIILWGDNVDQIIENLDAFFGIKTYSLYYFQSDLYGWFTHGFLGPLTAVAFYFYIYPLISYPVYEHLLATRRKIKSIRIRSENARLLTVEESREINVKLAKIQSEFEQKEDDYRQQIKSLLESQDQKESTDNSDTKEDAPPSQVVHNTDGHLLPPLNLKYQLDPSEFLRVDSHPSKASKDPSKLKGTIEFNNFYIFKAHQLFAERQWELLPIEVQESVEKELTYIFETGLVSAVEVLRGEKGSPVEYRYNRHEIRESLPKFQKEILTLLKTFNEEVLLEALYKDFPNKSKSTIDFCINELKGKYYIHNYNKNDLEIVKISALGRKYLKTQRLR